MSGGVVAMQRPGRRSKRRVGRAAVVVAVFLFSATWGLPNLSSDSQASATGLVVLEENTAASKGFLSKVFSAALQGATAASVAALLSAAAEPIVNRLLVERMTVAQAMSEISCARVLKFFMTTLPTNLLKFPVFEVISMVMSFTSLSGGLRGVMSGWLFCTIMLPVTNYRFQKSMGWEINPALLYQAYIPTVARDVAYGAARGIVGEALHRRFSPGTLPGKAMLFGVTVWASCIISSPGNEWRGYTLQAKEKKKPFAEYFRPTSYVRSTGIGATIMGVALTVGMMITPYAEMLFTYCRSHLLQTLAATMLAGVVAGALQGKPRPPVAAAI